MRPIAALVGPLVPLAVTATLLAGCGSGSSASPRPQVHVTGQFGKSPAVRIPTTKPGKSLVVKTVVKGNGQQLGSTDSFVGNFVAYDWSGTKHNQLASTFTQGLPTLFAGKLLPGLEKALRGKPMGSRVLAVIPPADGYGSKGNPQGGIKGTDTLVFVIDMINDYTATSSAGGQQVSHGGGALPTVGSAQGSAPSVTLPKGSPPKSLMVRTLVRGTGPAITKGQYVITQYVGEIWRTKKVFDSSWQRRQPFGARIAAQPSQVIPGWDKGLVGQTIGSRVLLVIPPSDGYGKTGNRQAGIKATDSLVFVVDILGAYSSAATSK